MDHRRRVAGWELASHLKQLGHSERQGCESQLCGPFRGTVGLYQANFLIPNVIAGDRPLVITVNGVKSAPATITIGD
jgi:hypothetical protein